LRRQPTLLWTGPVATAARNRWARVTPHLIAADQRVLLFATLHAANGESIAGNLYLSRGRPRGLLLRRRHSLIVFIPAGATELRLYAIGAGATTTRAAGMSLRPVSRPLASAWLLAGAPPGTLWQLARRVALHPTGFNRQFRQFLAATANEARIPQRDYAAWLRLFDHWDDQAFGGDPQPSIAYLAVGRPGSAALDATLAALAVQRGGAVHRVLDPSSTLSVAEALVGLKEDYIGILAAGEVLPPYATQLAADQLRRLDQPDIAIADEDSVAPDGQRHSPLFKPVPNRTMMLSGLLSSGLWLVARRLLAEAGGAAGPADVIRLRSWFTRQERDSRPFGARIPFILSHRRPDAERASPETLAALVAAHLTLDGPAIAPIPTWPLSFRLADGPGDREPGRVTVIIPSTLRHPHAARCIRAVLEGTDYPALDLHVVLMQPSPPDERQRAATEALKRYPNATVHWLKAPRFNFSTANNYVAARTAGDNILLLNDDVTPIRPDWLRWMLAFMADPTNGIVGARLLYPDGRVQHGGVIMGLSGLCDHAHRYLPGDDPGYMQRAVVAQQLSAVTAACMLVRRSLYERVGGLDESYPSAFNDVDFALRVGETGHNIVYAPQAELHHHEMLTYGSHYAGDRQPFYVEEVERMQHRWAKVCADDPFHNPNLGLTIGFEGHLAFPPRTGSDYG